MTFQVSPGVNVSEIDLTTVIPAVSTTEGALVAEFQWGPIDERVLIDSEDVLGNRFWTPNNDVANGWFTGANFLAYGNKLFVLRVADTGANTALNATSDGTGVLIRNDDHYELNFEDGSLTVGNWTAKYAGALGNNLKVSTCPTAAAFQSVLAGTIDIAANTNIIVGTDTVFTADNIGDILDLGAQSIKITAVANTISATLETVHVVGVVADTAVVRNWEYFALVDGAPGTSPAAVSAGGTNDEIHVVVIDEDSGLTGVTETTLEIYPFLSLASDAKKGDGSSNYYKNVVNRQSTWIRWTDHEPTTTNAGGVIGSAFSSSTDLSTTDSLAGGRRGGAPSDGDKILGWDFFKDAADVDVSLLLGADASQTVAIHMINNIAESRRDCIAVLSPERDDVVNNLGNEAVDVIAFRNTLPSTSYAVLDSGWKYQYDKYNDIFRYLPLNGDIAGLMVRTDTTRDPWWSPAGYNRGNIKNVIKLPYNPRQADRDLLYKSGVNSVITQPGLGTVLFGDKTLLATPSAFDRINVRRLFIVLEKAIATASKFTLFEFNDEFTRNQFRNMVEPFLRDVQGRRGIFDFRVVADETNNTGEVIDRNEFIGDIYIKPARAINFIQLNFVAVRTAVEFDEIVGKF